MNTQNTILKEINTIASQCDRCGSCHLVCPLITPDDREACGARGKISAARALAHGRVAAEADILEAAEYCLLCGACTDVCASKVKTPDVMLKVREYLASQSTKSTGFSAEDQLKLEQAFSSLCTENAKLAPDTARAANVSYFYGCKARLMSPDAAVSTLKVLHMVANVDLVNNTCCGLPSLTRGNLDDFKSALKQNIQMFADSETIICDCACCGDTLKQAASYLADDQDFCEQAKVFSTKIKSLTEYLQSVGYTPKTSDKKITYHEPCHLGRGQGIKNAPRYLLKAAGDFVELAGANVCCGGSCSFPTDYPQAADKLAEQKGASIEKTGAELVATECHHCLAQLKKAADKSGGKFRAVHISEIL